MQCREIQPLIDPYVDRELDAAATEEVEHHLADCGDCAAARDRLMVLRTATLNLRHPAPPAFASSIRSAIRADLDARRSRSLKMWRLTALAACLVAAVSVGWAILNAPRNAATGTLAAEVVENHVRSLMADHLVDVASSDQHTVKPWFTGRIDFAPDVRDFAADGFPLIGGRLDYLQGHAAVALVYRHDKHVINAFTWPAGAGDAATDSLETHAGYHVLRWRDGAMNWSLVSDAGEATLEQLRQLIEQHPQ